MLEDDPDKINDAERQIEAKIGQIGEAYAASNKRQKTENKTRAENRAKIKEMGIRTDAYQVGVKLARDLTETERKDFMRDLTLVVKVLGAKQQELFPDEALKAAKREQAKKDKAAKAPRSKEELDAASEENPRSDPNSGGAKPQVPEVDTRPPELRSSDPVIDESLKSVLAREQEEGDAALDAGLPQTKKSQSEIAAERRAAAKLN